MSAKPQPRVTARVCSLCGLDWKRHGKNPTAEKCIALLLDEVRSLNSQLAHRPYARPWPLPIPYVQPYSLPVPYRPWTTPIYCGNTSGTGQYTPAVSNVAPRAITQRATC